jgi:DNA-directed RNA polymerase specialized sigma24 family protein
VVRTKLRKAGIPEQWLEDLVQTVFLTALGKRTIPRGHSPLRRWLMDIARKHAANWRRLHRRFYEVISFECLREEPIDPAVDVERSFMVAEGVGRLEPEERDVCLVYADGASWREVAEAWGVCKARAHAVGAPLVRRARKKLLEDVGQ